MSCSSVAICRPSLFLPNRGLGHVKHIQSHAFTETLHAITLSCSHSTVCSKAAKILHFKLNSRWTNTPYTCTVIIRASPINRTIDVKVKNVASATRKPRAFELRPPSYPVPIRAVSSWPQPLIFSLTCIYLGVAAVTSNVAMAMRSSSDPTVFHLWNETWLCLVIPTEGLGGSSKEEIVCRQALLWSFKPVSFVLNCAEETHACTHTHTLWTKV